MYAREKTEVYVELGHLEKGSCLTKSNKPDQSKVGGFPAWFGEPPLSEDDLRCRLCGRSLFLVAQVSAPTQFPRALCVFGCNRATCSAHSRGWRVIRTQGKQHDESCSDSSETASGLVSNQSIAAETVSGQPARDGWGDSSWGEDDGDDWGAGASGGGGGGWGDAEELDGDDGADADASSMSAIGVLLAEQEARLRQGVNSLSCSGGRPNGRSNGVATGKCHGSNGAGRKHESTPGFNAAASVSAVRCKASGSTHVLSFPAKVMEFTPEPWEKTKSGGDDEDMKRRIRRYRDQEEDPGLVAALDEALGTKNPALVKRSAEGSGSSFSATAGEKYERTPARAKAVLKFAERVARAPKQVVRYAYGGEPLWSSCDPPKIQVPPCVCGAARVFEMQLMPALLLELQVNKYAVPDDDEERDVVGDGEGDPVLRRADAGVKVGDDPSLDTGGRLMGSRDGLGSVSEKERSYRGKNDADDGERTGGASDDEEEDEMQSTTSALPTPSRRECERVRTWGMDWGVVTVWSCPRSCDSSYQEEVVVQRAV